MANGQDTTTSGEGSLSSTLKTTGRRLTGQRQLLLGVLREHGGHLDAHDLYRLASERNPRLSLSTVYRTMNLLRDLGLVDVVYLGQNHHHYELKPTSEHCHLVCANCGAVVEISCDLVEQLKDRVAEQYDFEISDARVDLVGLCGACRAR